MSVAGRLHNAETDLSRVPNDANSQRGPVEKNDGDQNNTVAHVGAETGMDSNRLGGTSINNDSIQASGAYKGGAKVLSYETAELIESFLNKLNPLTRRNYSSSIAQFGKFFGLSSPSEIAHELFGHSLGHANYLVLEYASHLKTKKLAAGTIRIRIQAIKSFVRFANVIGLVPWQIAVQAAPPSQAFRDTRGPGTEGVRKLFEVAAKDEGPIRLRNIAMLRLMWDLGLRRCEIHRLDVEDVNFDEGSIWILGKMRTEKERLTLPWESLKALKEYVGDSRSGPLFISVNGGKFCGKRVSLGYIYDIVRNLGKRCGLNAWPHGIRHAAITEGLDKTNGNNRSVQRFARHKNVNITMIYDDNRQDLAGDVARLVSSSISSATVAA